MTSSLNPPTTDYLSLYDYLKKPAGSKLGLQVFTYAKLRGIKPMTKEINQGGHTRVMCYPPRLLKEYFTIANNLEAYKKCFN